MSRGESQESEDFRGGKLLFNFLEVIKMVNPVFLKLSLLKPTWLGDKVAVAISRYLRSRNWELDSVLQQSDSYAIFKLKPADGRRLSSTWVLWIKKPSSPLDAVEWGVGRWER